MYFKVQYFYSFDIYLWSCVSQIIIMMMMMMMIMIIIIIIIIIIITWSYNNNNNNNNNSLMITIIIRLGLRPMCAILGFSIQKCQHY